MSQIKSLSNPIQSALAGLVAHYRDLASDGMSLADVWSLVQRAAASILAVLDQISTLDRAAKNAVALEAVGDLFDAIAPVVDIPFVPELVETRLVDPVARKIVLQLAERAIAVLGQVLDRTGGNAAPDPTEATGGIPVIPGVRSAGLFLPY